MGVHGRRRAQNATIKTSLAGMLSSTPAVTRHEQRPRKAVLVDRTGHRRPRRHQDVKGKMRERGAHSLPSRPGKDMCWSDSSPADSWQGRRCNRQDNAGGAYEKGTSVGCCGPRAHGRTLNDWPSPKTHRVSNRHGGIRIGIGSDMQTLQERLREKSYWLLTAR